MLCSTRFMKAMADLIPQFFDTGDIYLSTFRHYCRKHHVKNIFMKISTRTLLLPYLDYMFKLNDISSSLLH